MKKAWNKRVQKNVAHVCDESSLSSAKAIFQLKMRESNTDTIESDKLYTKTKTFLFSMSM